jgi:hypothetical protein
MWYSQRTLANDLPVDSLLLGGYTKGWFVPFFWGIEQIRDDAGFAKPDGVLLFEFGKRFQSKLSQAVTVRLALMIHYTL